MRSLFPGPWGHGSRLKQLGSEVGQPGRLCIACGMGRPDHCRVTSDYRNNVSSPGIGQIVHVTTGRNFPIRRVASIGQRNTSSTSKCKTVPYVTLSHPFLERLIGTLRRECLDRTLFWTATDLEAKLLDYQHYYNEHRTHAGRKGHPPVTGVNVNRSLANLSCSRWQKHCGGLYQTPIAA